MEISDALAALRELDALPDARRRYLAALAADAPNDADRARLVFLARYENRRVREQTEADLKADYAARAALADYSVEHPEEGPQKPGGVRRWHEDDVTYPQARPVTISWTTPTKTAPEQVPPKRRRLNEPVRHHGSSPGRNETPKPKPEPKPPRPLPEHGTVTRYQLPHLCRCDSCRAAKSAANRRERERRAEKRSAQSPK